MQTLISLIGIGLFILAAYSDVKTFRIPNLLVAAVALLGVTRLVTTGDPSAALYTVGASTALLAIGFVLFAQGFIGGGDAKLVTAVALLVGYHDLFSFLLLMGICGGLFSFAVLVTRRFLPPYLGPWLAVLLPTAPLAVPYGVAIATAGSVTLFLQSPLATSSIG